MFDGPLPDDMASGIYAQIRRQRFPLDLPMRQRDNVLPEQRSAPLNRLLPTLPRIKAPPKPSALRGELEPPGEGV